MMMGRQGDGAVPSECSRVGANKRAAQLQGLHASLYLELEFCYCWNECGVVLRDSVLTPPHGPKKSGFMNVTVVQCYVG